MQVIQDGLSRRLQSERKRVGLTQDQLRSTTGLSKVTLSGYENGATSPTVHFLADISKQGLDVHYILFGGHELQGAAQLAQSFKLIRDCYDQVSFFIAANCKECPDLHRWKMVQELYISSRGQTEVCVQKSQVKLREIYTRFVGLEIGNGDEFPAPE